MIRISGNLLAAGLLCLGQAGCTTTVSLPPPSYESPTDAIAATLALASPPAAPLSEQETRMIEVVCTGTPEEFARVWPASRPVAAALPGDPWLSPLAKAADCGNLAQFTHILGQVPDLSAPDLTGRVPLDLAAETGQPDFIDAALAAGAQINPRRGFILVEASMRGFRRTNSWAALDRLLQAGLDLSGAHTGDPERTRLLGGPFTALLISSKSDQETCKALELHNPDWPGQEAYLDFLIGVPSSFIRSAPRVQMDCETQLIARLWGQITPERYNSWLLWAARLRMQEIWQPWDPQANAFGPPRPVPASGPANGGT